MSDWDFLWGLEGEELIDAMSSGGTYEDWAYIDEIERKKSENNFKDNSQVKKRNILNKK